LKNKYRKFSQNFGYPALLAVNKYNINYINYINYIKKNNKELNYLNTRFIKLNTKISPAEY